MKANFSPRDIELLSAYLDRQLDSNKRSRLEARLRGDVGLRAALEDLQRTRALLRSLPRMKAPRSFMLTPQMVSKYQAKTTAPRRIYPLFQFASALASLLLVVVLLGDFLGFGAAPAVLPASAPAEPRFSVLSGQTMSETLDTSQPEGVTVIQGSAAETPTPPPAQEKMLSSGVTTTITTTGELSNTVPSTQETLSSAPTNQAGSLDSTVLGAPGENLPPDRSLWRAAEILLALIALVSALAAIYLHRRQ
jgi:hypothetical protein